MTMSKILRNTFLIITACLILSACATKKVTDAGGQMQGDVYIGSDTVEYLASGVPDRVFFATNESILTTRSRDTLRKQATWLRKNPEVSVVVEGHADERGSTEYNLALGNRRAVAVRDFLTGFGLSESRFSVVSFGEERPLESGSDESAWSRNRRGQFVITAGANAINPGN